MKKCCENCYFGELIFKRFGFYRCKPTNKIRRGNKKRRCPLFWAEYSL